MAFILPILKVEENVASKQNHQVHVLAIKNNQILFSNKATILLILQRPRKSSLKTKLSVSFIGHTEAI